MKLTLTQSEIKSEFADKHNLNASDIEIESNNFLTGNKPVFQVMGFINAVRLTADYRHVGKIQAIKNVREYAATMGFFIPLVDAKNFVESIS